MPLKRPSRTGGCLLTRWSSADTAVEVRTWLGLAQHLRGKRMRPASPCSFLRRSHCPCTEQDRNVGGTDRSVAIEVGN